MKAYKVYWKDENGRTGDYITSMNATPEEACAYFVGRRFVLDENEFTGEETYATFTNVEVTR